MPRTIHTRAVAGSISAAPTNELAAKAALCVGRPYDICSRWHGLETMLGNITVLSASGARCEAPVSRCSGSGGEGILGIARAPARRLGRPEDGVLGDGLDRTSTLERGPCRPGAHVD